MLQKQVMVCIVLMVASIALSAQTLNQPYPLKKESTSTYRYGSQSFKCATGNCENGQGTLLVEFKYKLKVWGDWTNKAEYYAVEGNFINGRISGFGKVMQFFTQDAFKQYKPQPYDSLRMMNEVLQSLNNDFYDASAGYFIGGVMRRGMYIDSYNRIWDAFYDRSTVVFGTLSIPSQKQVYRGFLCAAAVLPNQGWIANYCPIVGLRLEIKNDTSKLVPFGDNISVNDALVLPFSESVYDPNRKPVQQLNFDNGIYNGEAVNGVPEGFGEWMSNDYLWIKFGYFKNGKLHGLSALNFDINQGKGPEIVYGYAVAQFNNGVAARALTGIWSSYYRGEINAAFLASGYGVKMNSMLQLKYEEGYFEDGQLNGAGKQTYTDGRVVSGNFVKGKLTAGTTTYTVNSLRVGDVVRVNGKKYAVIENPWDPNTYQTLRGYVKLHDGSMLKTGTDFEKLNESSGQFFETCKKCVGTGVLQQYNNTKVVTSVSPMMSRTVNTPQGYREETYYNYSYGTELKHSGKVTCNECNGAGRFVKKQ